jgi:hypothetical protein
VAASVAVVVTFHFSLVGLAEFFDSLGNASEAYHRRFANVLIVNGPQYNYCSSRIQPDDIQQALGPRSIMNCS